MHPKRKKSTLERRLSQTRSYIAASSAGHLQIGVVGLLEPGFIYDMRHQQVNGRWAVVALRVLPRPSDWERRVIAAGVGKPPDLEDPDAPPLETGLSAKQLREISFAVLDGDRLGQLFTAGNKIARAYLGPPRKQHRIRPLGKGPVRLARVAEQYVLALQFGSRHPNVDVAERFDMRVSAVRDAVHQARAQGLLTPLRLVKGTRTNGIVGGELTAAALALLEEAR